MLTEGMLNSRCLLIYLPIDEKISGQKKHPHLKKKNSVIVSKEKRNWFLGFRSLNLFRP